MKALATVEVMEHGDVPVAVVQGEVDMANGEEIRTQLLDAVTNAAPGLVVDLNGVTYLDSRGVHILLDLDRRLRRRQQQLRVAIGQSAKIRRILTLTAVNDDIPFDDTIEDAVARLRRPA